MMANGLRIQFHQKTCTSTGIMLTQVQSALPQALNAEPYPEWKTQQKSREYPLSDHDTKHALKDGTHGVGRRKCPDDRRQHNSHFCLCHDGAHIGPVEGYTTLHESDFTVKQAVNIPSSNRKFTRNHKQKSAEAALAQAREPFMWFGRHDSDLSETLQVLPTAQTHPSPERFKALDGSGELYGGSSCQIKN